MKGLFNLTWENIKSAVIYGLLTIFIVFVLSVIESILSAGTIFGIDWKSIIDKSVLASLGVLVMFVSMIKNMLTTSSGKFLGAVDVIPDKK